MISLGYAGAEGTSRPSRQLGALAQNGQWHPASILQYLFVIAHELLAQRLPRLGRNGLAGIIAHLLMDLWVEQRIHRIGEVFHKGLHVQQKPVIALLNEVYRTTGTRPNGRHAGGLRLLNGLAEGLKLTGVDKNIQRGIGRGKFFARQSASKHGPRKLGFQ